MFWKVCQLRITTSPPQSNSLHPKVCAGALGLLVSPTTEPLRVGVRAVADMVPGVLCRVVSQGGRRYYCLEAIAVRLHIILSTSKAEQ